MIFIFLCKNEKWFLGVKWKKNDKQIQKVVLPPLPPLNIIERRERKNVSERFFLPFRLSYSGGVRGAKTFFCSFWLRHFVLVFIGWAPIFEKWFSTTIPKEAPHKIYFFSYSAVLFRSEKRVRVFFQKKTRWAYKNHMICKNAKCASACRNNGYFYSSKKILNGFKKAQL